jgi:2-aminoadipate transaminase
VANATFESRDLRSVLARDVPAFWREEPQLVRWSFDSGRPDPSSFPRDDFLRLTDRVLAGSTDAVQYGQYFDGIMYGFRGLREQLAERARLESGRDVHAGQVLLTSGAVQAITLAFDAFVDAGDVIAVEAPTWGAVLACAQRRRAETVSIPVDRDGLDVDVLDEVIERLHHDGRRLTLFYTIASFNTPTGATLSLERRRRLLELATRFGFLVVEDNVYRALRYSGDVVPTLFGLDEAALVLQVDTFSKTIAPALRTGWAIGHPDVVAALATVREDLGVSQLTARVLAEYLDGGLYEPHIDRVTTLYREKLEATERALHAWCDPWVQWTTPDGGFCLWVEVDPSRDVDLAMARAMEDGAVVRTGERFFDDAAAGARRFRLSFSEVPLAALDEGIAVLGSAMARSAR